MSKPSTTSTTSAGVTTATVAVGRRELDGPPVGEGRDAILEWIARRAGVTVAEVRRARAAGIEQRITTTGDPELDKVRRVVELALDHGAPSSPTPRSSRRPARASSRRPRTTRSIPQSTATTPAADRAARYGRRAR
jgi:hypothetical protein